MALAGDAVFVAGVPALLRPDNPVEAYQAAYEGKLGGVRWTASAADGRKPAEIQLATPPAWDGLAAAASQLYRASKTGNLPSFAGAR